jgi:hypothetical protein
MLEKNKYKSAGVGYLINSIQTLFVGMLRIWTIPIVLMLSVASGFTTYYGLSHFITPWIALVITVAIQSIVVICSLEMGSIHWKANRVRYLSVLLSLATALTASVSFSYFKFYEISQKETIHINRLQELRHTVKDYLKEVLQVKNKILEGKQQELQKLSHEVSQAYFGTHPEISPAYKNQVGEGPFWKRYKQLYDSKKEQLDAIDLAFTELDGHIQSLQMSLNELDRARDAEAVYYDFLSHYQTVQTLAGKILSLTGQSLPDAPLLMTYKQFTEEIKPSVSMWKGFSAFAFICAAMVDFFTVLLSYRLEFTAPGPLTHEEEELIFECLRQFTEFSINENDELQMVIEKTELEKARRYSDWSRMFAVGLLLNRGFLRKVDHRTVEFAPNLYPLVAEKMGDKIRQLKALSNVSANHEPDEHASHE